MGERMTDAQFVALLEKNDPAEVRRNREELENLILYARTDQEFERMGALLAEAKKLTGAMDYKLLAFRAHNRRIYVQGPPPKPPRAGRKRRKPDAVDQELMAERAAQRRQETLTRQRGREVEAQHMHSGNMSALARILNHPAEDVDLRKVRGRVTRAMARLPEDKAADLLRRYEEFAAAVQKLRAV